jgi:hypothetical protein
LPHKLTQTASSQTDFDDFQLKQIVKFFGRDRQQSRPGQRASLLILLRDRVTDALGPAS